MTRYVIHFSILRWYLHFSASCRNLGKLSWFSSRIPILELHHLHKVESRSTYKRDLPSLCPLPETLLWFWSSEQLHFTPQVQISSLRVGNPTQTQNGVDTGAEVLFLSGRHRGRLGIVSANGGQFISKWARLEDWRITILLVCSYTSCHLCQSVTQGFYQLPPLQE